MAINSLFVGLTKVVKSDRLILELDVARARGSPPTLPEASNSTQHHIGRHTMRCQVLYDVFCLIQLILQPEIICYHRDKLRIRGLSAVVLLEIKFLLTKQ